MSRSEEKNGHSRPEVASAATSSREPPLCHARLAGRVRSTPFRTCTILNGCRCPALWALAGTSGSCSSSAASSSVVASGRLGRSGLTRKLPNIEDPPTQLALRSSIAAVSHVPGGSSSFVIKMPEPLWHFPSKVKVPEPIDYLAVGRPFWSIRRLGIDVLDMHSVGAPRPRPPASAVSL